MICRSLKSSKVQIEKMIQTDNSFLEEKIQLRLNSIEKMESPIRILECFTGDGVIWDAVRQRTDKEIKILRIDIKPDRKGLYLIGDNKKFLSGFDLTTFNIIDLDAYGSPFEQLEIIFKKKYSGVIHCTFIRSGMGGMNHDLLEYCGYTKRMIKKCPTLIMKGGFELFCQYLANNGVPRLQVISIDRKHYFWFTTA